MPEDIDFFIVSLLHIVNGFISFSEVNGAQLLEYCLSRN